MTGEKNKTPYQSLNKEIRLLSTKHWTGVLFLAILAGTIIFMMLKLSFILRQSKETETKTDFGMPQITY